MGTMRPGGMNMGARAERTPRGRSARVGQDDQPKSKPDLKKLWPQVKALVKPRLGLLLAGMGLMVINRVALLVMPYISAIALDADDPDLSTLIHERLGNIGMTSRATR